ncbi:hypothetical protein SSX86_001637 [Deinandra increscens subsp. villosa]|uniref:Uncharacterized protein n=1 Tax=Deinandra increscens subsp. villosa TaxID=3103831 RepID=A0AAP0HCU0_9ASTR
MSSFSSPTNPPRRPLTCRQSQRAVNQVREAVNQLRKLDFNPSISPDLVTSSATSTESPISKPNISKSLPEKAIGRAAEMKNEQTLIQILKVRARITESRFNLLEPRRRRFDEEYWRVLQDAAPISIDQNPFINRSIADVDVHCDGTTLRNKHGFDEAFNYKEELDLVAALARLVNPYLPAVAILLSDFDLEDFGSFGCVCLVRLLSS